MRYNISRSSWGSASGRSLRYAAHQHPQADPLFHRIRTDDPTFKTVWKDIAQRGGFDRPPRQARHPELNAGAARILERGQELYARGKLESSKEKFLEALKIEPDFPNAHNCLAIVLAKQGDTEDAIRHFQQAIQEDPDNTDFLFNLADLYQKQSRWEDALQTFEQVLRVNPIDAEADIMVRRLKNVQLRK